MLKKTEKEDFHALEDVKIPQKKNVVEKVVDYFKDEWKFLVFLALLIFGLTYEFPYAIYKPGGSINMSDRVEGDNMYDEKGSLSMTYVSVVRGTAPFLLVSFLNSNWDVVPTKDITYDDADLDETLEIDKIYMKEAISNAEYVAYDRANIRYEEKEKHSVVTYVSKDARTKLKYGDEIISIDGRDYTTLLEFQNYVSAKKPGDEVRIEYIRDGDKAVDVVTLIDVEGTAKVGLSIATISDFETDFDIDIKTKESESGPSGGFITALAIYNRITEEDLTKGKTIMGTGTIDRDGLVGEIGGVKYKLLGAVRKGAEVFLCPEENYEEALKVKKENELDIVLLSAKTFDEALQKLAEL